MDAAVITRQPACHYQACMPLTPPAEPFSMSDTVWGQSVCSLGVTFPLCSHTGAVELLGVCL